MELFTNLEIMIMESVVGFLVLVILLLSILEFLSKKKETKNEIEEVDNSLEEEVKEVQTEVLDNSIKEEEITLETLEEDIKTLTRDYSEELKPIIENTIKEDDFIQEELEVTPQITIECLEPEEEEIEVLELEPEVENKATIELAKIQEELEHPQTLEDTINNLEQLEEESAIISYQELLSVTSEMPIIEDMEDEPISITEVYEKFTGEKIESPNVQDIYEASIKNGIETENLNEIQLENTANLEKLDKEIRKTNKVLNMLNELKKNLD